MGNKKYGIIGVVIAAAVSLVTLMPQTHVEAATASSGTLQLRINSYGAPYLSGSTGEHSVYSITTGYTIYQSDVGSDNASGVAEAYFVGSNETGWDLNVKVTIGNFTKVYSGKDVSNARVTNRDMSEATAKITFGFSFNQDNPRVSTTMGITGSKAIPVTPTDSDDVDPIVVPDDDDDDSNHKVITQSKTVTRTINYVYEDNEQAAEPYEDSITFVREGVSNLITGETEWGEWRPAKTYTFAEVDSPVIENYRASKLKVEAIEVGTDSEDIVENIVYSKISSGVVSEDELDDRDDEPNNIGDSDNTNRDGDIARISDVYNATESSNVSASSGVEANVYGSNLSYVSYATKSSDNASTSSVATGDTTYVNLWMVAGIIAIAGVGVASIAYIRSKKH